MKLRPIMLAAAMFACAQCGGTTLGHAESVFVKYRGEVDLKPFECTDIARSSFIDRVCYDRRNEYMLISLNGTFYHYCEINAGTVSSLLTASSMGRFYNASIKGAFDCRIHQVPSY
jgi:KTSC domain-containing protein